MKGRLVEAESMWLAAMEEANNFAEDDTRRAITYEGLAESYFRQGKNREAESCCRRLLSLYRRVHGHDHIDVAITASNLAMLLHMAHNYNDAEPLYKQSIAIKTKVLGAAHPDVLRLLEGYADLLMKTHREAEAKHLQVCAQGMSTGRWNRSTTNIPMMHQNAPARGAPANSAQGYPAPSISAVAKTPQGQFAPPQGAPPPANKVQQSTSYPPGAQYSTNAVSRSQPPAPPQPSTPARQKPASKNGQPPSPLNWFVYKEFADEALRRGNLDVAETQWLAAIKESEHWTHDRQKLAYALDSLADIMCRTQKYDEAESVMTRCIGIKTDALGQLHPLVAMSVSTLARLYYLKKDYLMAESLMGDCIQIYEKGLGDHPETASALYNFAMIYHQQMKLQEAESVYKKCWEMRKRMLGPDHPDTKKVYVNLAKILEAKQPVKPIIPQRREPVPVAASGGKRPLTEHEQAITGSWKVLELPDNMRLDPDE